VSLSTPLKFNLLHVSVTTIDRRHPKPCWVSRSGASKKVTKPVVPPLLVQELDGAFAQRPKQRWEELEDAAPNGENDARRHRRHHRQQDWRLRTFAQSIPTQSHRARPA